MQNPTKICLVFFFIVFVFIPKGKASNIDSLVRRFHEKTKQTQNSLNVVRTYQRTHERITNNIIADNQRKIAEQNRRIKDQNRLQRANLDALKRKIDNLKRQQSYYYKVKTRNPLNSHFNNIRNTYK